MNKDRWLYKVGGDMFWILPMMIVLVAFSGTTFWLYTIKNNMFRITLAMTAFAVAIALYALYRSIVIRFLIGENGIYYRSRPGNGRYYSYDEIKEAWESSGKTAGGMVSYYCNFKDADGNTVRIPFVPNDSDGIDWFLSKINGESDENTDVQ